MSNARGPLAYLLRTALALGLVKLVVLHELPLQSYPYLLGQLQQLDLYRALFYALLPLFGLLLFIPTRSTKTTKTPSRLRTPLALGLGLLAALLPLGALRWARPDMGMGHAWIASVYLGANLALLILLNGSGKFGRRMLLIVFRLVILVDILFPMAVWSAYRRNSRLPLLLLRPLPAYLVCCAPLLALLLQVQPQSEDQSVRIDPRLRLIAQGSYYKMAVVPDTGNLILAEDQNRVVLLDPHSGALLGKFEAGPDSVQGVALDSASHSVLLTSLSLGRTTILDDRDLSLRQTIDWDRSFKLENERTQAYWDAQSRTLCAMTGAEIVLLCPDGRTVKARFYMGQPSDLAFDPQRDELHTNIWIPPLLLALDRQSLRVKRQALLLPMAERIALDQDNDRIFVTLPVAALVSVVDLKTYATTAEIKSFPGVRAVGVDERRGLLLLAGFSPLLEIRSLRDFSLIAQMHAPPWARYIHADSTRGRAYITTAQCGVWALDLDKFMQETDSGKRRSLDPFYVLLDVLNPRIDFVSTWADATGGWPLDPPTVYQETCPAGSWQ